MKLTDLRPAPGATRTRLRVGRGLASGSGKTSNRGHRGQGQRSGYKRRFGFEGGQTPLFRRLPKLHNFGWVKRRNWVVINLGDLANLPAGTEVTPASLVEFKILDAEPSSLRVLGVGEIKGKLTVKAHHVTAGAKEKIEAAGGSVELIGPAEPTRMRRQPKQKQQQK